MSQDETAGAGRRPRGVTRRSLLTWAACLAALMGLPDGAARAMADALAGARRRSVIWLSFQECTACTESFTRAFAPTLEALIFNQISLDYHHLLQAASGGAAEDARRAAMTDDKGRYLLVVEGSVPLGDDGAFSTIAGVSNLVLLREAAADAAAVIAVGTCAAFGGVPFAHPNPTGAAPVSQIIGDKPLINIPGCPPVPEAIAGTLAHLLAFGQPPELDELNRPRAFFGNTVHSRCYRRHHYIQRRFAESFDDDGARQGWCLYKLGCRGPVTSAACATVKWNGGASFPIQAGHGCLGCTEPGFWDKGSFYAQPSTPVSAPNPREPDDQPPRP